jgi:hypothetical protein
MLHGGYRTVVVYGGQAGSNALPWRYGDPACSTVVMTDTDRVRDAIKAYMAANGLNPTRWSTESGLSERALSHFLSGRSKSLSPKSLERLAASRRVAIREMLGFLPSYLDPTGEGAAAAEAAPENLAGAVLQMAEQIRQLVEKVDELTKRVPPPAGDAEEKP